MIMFRRWDLGFWLDRVLGPMQERSTKHQGPGCLWIGLAVRHYRVGKNGAGQVRTAGARSLQTRLG